MLILEFLGEGVDKEILDHGPLATGIKRMVLMGRQWQQLNNLYQVQNLLLTK
jgi:hypothetical protein